MMEGVLSQAAESMHGNLYGSDGQFRGVSTDTRTLRAGELFFAIEGPHFDGNKFVNAAAERKAAAAVVSRQCDSDLPNIAVADTRLALGELAAAWRRQLSATVIGITGSNGKTTVKEMLASCLSQSAETLATRGNLNNDIGMPLVLLELDPKHEYAVIEMGANHAGEIGYLSNIAQPDVVVITNAAPAHLEGFGSLEGVSRAKAEILQHETRPRFAVLNADDPFFSYWRTLVTDIELITFGIEQEATVSATDIELHPTESRFVLQLPCGDLNVSLALPGAHNVLNACAAAAVAFGLDIDPVEIRQGLESAVPVSGRLQPLRGIKGASLYDDSYNANPVSVIAAAEFLAAEGGDTFLVLGDMGELGEGAQSLHEDVGRAARNAGIDRLMATGELSLHTVSAFGSGADWYASSAELIDALKKEIGSNSNILVKGSRSTHMERVVDALRAAPDEQQEN